MTPQSDTEPVEDEHFFVIKGRRWRRTDPSIPEALRKQLVNQLMDARRAVKSAKAADDDEAMAIARARVNDAKLALGERGEPWWEEASPEGLTTRARATVRTLLNGRSDGATICPSEVARTIGGEEWRNHSARMRELAIEMADAGEIEILQHGKVVDPASLRGAIRLGRPSHD